ncbi:16S rRNA (uracil(1498)-N(3))-methyltransferase [Shimazuella sp. AN120528]|uniref:RsmE family RNA methyltransferase n=1 Tax=Shimazuella soli TaxID=1892854 RepID=UPI001F0FBADF|nr:RsmE family RNA methyltransferase [Shimazuella soli]MCH5583850.1 16S rRNA (uracil(1498)-N(3))-methyltransferase [Shimazuella soli]
MQRYFITPDQLIGDVIHITGDDVHHIRTVLRSQIGDTFICCMMGMDYLVEIESISSSAVNCHVIESSPSIGEPSVQVTLAQGLPKGEKFEWILQKGTELGATAFLPFSSSRTIVKLEGNKVPKKRDRWAKIVKEAAEQSHRGIIPSVELPLNWKALLSEIPNYDVAIIAYEKGGLALQTVPFIQESKSILMIIGPEGGFSEQEIGEAVEHGAKPITLGNRILRTETAAISLLSCLMFLQNELGGDQK